MKFFIVLEGDAIAGRRKGAAATLLWLLFNIQMGVVPVVAGIQRRGGLAARATNSTLRVNHRNRRRSHVTKGLSLLLLVVVGASI